MGSRNIRTLAGMVAIPVAITLLGAGAPVGAYEYGPYSAGVGTNQHTFPNESQTIQGTQYQGSSVNNCRSHRSSLRWVRPLRPDPVLASVGFTTGDLCGYRYSPGAYHDLGTVTIHGDGAVRSGTGVMTYLAFD